MIEITSADVPLILMVIGVPILGYVAYALTTETNGEHYCQVCHRKFTGPRAFELSEICTYSHSDDQYG